MRIFILSLISIFLMPAANAMAQTSLTDQNRQAFFQNCMAKAENKISPETQSKFCQCTGTQMQNNMSLEDVQTMARNDQAGRDALNKMLLTVYAPCMEYPVGDVILQRCLNNPEGQQIPEGICQCLSTKMAAFTAENAQNLLGDILKENPNIGDPMGPIVNSPTFAAEERRIAASCLQQAVR